MTAKPELILRLGSHAEKEYFEKLYPFLDGIFIGANLVEATPGATASLTVKFAGLGGRGQTPVCIDPMTYAFGLYTDRDTGRVRSDLDWIKSDQRVSRNKKETQRRVKKSYLALSNKLGGVFKSSVEAGVAISPKTFAKSGAVAETAAAVVNYQLERLPAVFKEDPEFQELANQVPKPTFVFAPYFYFEPSLADAWMQVSLELASAAVFKGKALGVPVHAVYCLDQGALHDETVLSTLASEIPKTGVQGAWLWFSQFQESSAEVAQLKAFRGLVTRLSTKMKVYNMHGGFFSLALSKFGLAGLSHGAGYGEQKDVIPVIGQSTPTVRYYVPPVRLRMGVPDTLRALKDLGITSPALFFEHVCDCAVCKGILANDLDQFEQFGEMHFSTAESKRQAQTPAAAKRCRYHFLLRRISERDWVGEQTVGNLLATLSASKTRWAKSHAIDCTHLARWTDALS